MNAVSRSRHTIVLMEVRESSIPPSALGRGQTVWVHATLDATAGRLILDLTAPQAVMTVDGASSRSLERWMRSVHAQYPSSTIVVTTGSSPAGSREYGTPDLLRPGAVRIPGWSVHRLRAKGEWASASFPVEHRGAIGLQHVACRVILGLNLSGVECGISWLAQQTAVVQPDRRAMHVRAALIELVVNAVEHGNLEITGQEKQAALAEHRYDVLLAARRRHPRFARRKVMVEVAMHESPKCIRYTVSDEGPGFDWPRVLGRMHGAQPSPDANGRGLQLIRALFPSLEYNNAGTVASFTVPLPST